MKLKMFAIMSVGALALGGCVATNSTEYMQDKAAATCMDRPTEQARKVCRETELAAMTAEEREFEQKNEAERLEKEHEQGVLEAYGVPPEDARRTQDSGLRAPGSPY